MPFHAVLLFQMPNNGVIQCKWWELIGILKICTNQEISTAATLLVTVRQSPTHLLSGLFFITLA
jgi:hypothetical protein